MTSRSDWSADIIGALPGAPYWLAAVSSWNAARLRDSNSLVHDTPPVYPGGQGAIKWRALFDHIFVTSAISAGQERAPVPGLYDEHDHVKASASHRWMIYDVDFQTGKIRWARELRKSEPPLLRHVKNSYASETPVTDGERVYV